MPNGQGYQKGKAMSQVSDLLKSLSFDRMAERAAEEIKITADYESFAFFDALMRTNGTDNRAREAKHRGHTRPITGRVDAGLIAVSSTSKLPHEQRSIADVRVQPRGLRGNGKTVRRMVNGKAKIVPRKHLKPLGFSVDEIEAGRVVQASDLT